MKGEKINVIAIIGPTAVGKTLFSLELAKALGAEIISVDSRQVYRYLNVGTDKVSLKVRREILHHLIDVTDPDQVFTAADFAEQATDAVRRIRIRGRIPLLIGGTPFYYKALSGTLSENLPKDAEIRAAIEKEIDERGLSSLYGELQSTDPAAAAKIHPHDAARVTRALEIFRITGKPATWWYDNCDKCESDLNIFYIGLLRSRENLYRNIESRIKFQFYNGYPEEVEWLLAHGYSPKLPSLQGFGYRELIEYKQGLCSFGDALAGDIRSTKAFSHRQMTWFKHFEPVQWYDLDAACEKDVLSDVLPMCRAYLEA